MFGPIVIGIGAGMATYVALGGENHPMMLVIAIFASIGGVFLASYLWPKTWG